MATDGFITPPSELLPLDMFQSANKLVELPAITEPKPLTQIDCGCRNAHQRIVTPGEDPRKLIIEVQLRKFVIRIPAIDWLDNNVTVALHTVIGRAGLCPGCLTLFYYHIEQ